MTASAPWRENPALLRALARAAAATARLDQASHRHPLLPALGHRARLEAVRQQAAADGHLIDPWHLAALIEGLRPRRMMGARSLAEAGEVFEAGRTALALHRWLTAPDGDDEAAVQAAQRALRQHTAAGVALLDAATAAWRWLETGGARAPLRAGLVRHWVACGLLRAPLPLTGARALQAEVAWAPETWIPAFLQALAEEAEAVLDLLHDLERGWTRARHATAGHRRHSRTPAAVDLLAALPLLSATSLARALGISIKSALRHPRPSGPGRRCGRGHRPRGAPLFGLRGLAPLAAAVAPPRRPEPGAAAAGRGWSRSRRNSPRRRWGRSRRLSRSHAPPLTTATSRPPCAKPRRPCAAPAARWTSSPAADGCRRLAMEKRRSRIHRQVLRRMLTEAAAAHAMMGFE
jgi:hypothetical protein